MRPDGSIQFFLDQPRTFMARKQSEDRLRRVARDFAIPTVKGRLIRERLTRMYGIPNAAPTTEDAELYVIPALHTRRSLFVDDEEDGKPVVYHIEEKEEWL